VFIQKSDGSFSRELAGPVPGCRNLSAETLLELTKLLPRRVKCEFFRNVAAGGKRAAGQFPLCTDKTLING
jgi:hypothetical protein